MVVPSVDFCAAYMQSNFLEEMGEVPEGAGFCVHGYNCYASLSNNLEDVLTDARPSDKCDQKTGTGVYTVRLHISCMIHCEAAHKLYDIML